MTNMTCWKKLKCECIRKWKHGRSGDKNIIQFLSTFMQKATTPPFYNCFLDCARSCEPFWLWQLYSVFTELVCWATSHPATKKGKSFVCIFLKLFFSVVAPRTLLPSIWRYLCTIGLSEIGPEDPYFKNIAKGTTDPRVEFISQDHSSQITNLEHILISKSWLSINFKISTKHQHLG